MRESNTKFINAVGKTLDNSLSPLDQNILERLEMARIAALSQDATARVQMEEREFATVKAALDIGAEDLDSRLSQRLDSIRHAAVNASSEQQRSPFGAALLTLRGVVSFNARMAVPAGMFAVMVTAVSLFYTSPPVETFTAAEEISLLASADDLELYENLDFYLWLAENGLPEEGI